MFDYPTHQKAKKLKESLKVKGLKVWLDEDNLGNHVAIGISEGLKQSAVIIVLLTEKYFERCENRDTNAHKEFIMATKKGLNWVLPLVMDEKLLNPANWIDGVVKYHLGDISWTAYAKPEQERQNLQEIVDTVKKLSTLKRLKVEEEQEHKQ